MNAQELSQTIASGIIDGSLFAMLGVSFWLIYSVTQRFHVAYVATYATGAYAAIWSRDNLPLPGFGDVLFGMLVAMLLGLACEGILYRRIERVAVGRGQDTLIPVFVASLGLTVVAQNVIAWIWNTQPLGFDIIENRGMALGDVRYTRLDLFTVVLAILMVTGAWGFTQFTRVGKRITGVKVNKEMARVVGIDTGRIFFLVFGLGSAGAGLLGILEASEAAASPYMGFSYVFYAFVIAFLAGAEATPLRLGVIGLLIGLAQSLSSLFMPTQYAPAVVFAVLLVYLIFLPMNLRRLFTIRTPTTSAGEA